LGGLRRKRPFIWGDLGGHGPSLTGIEEETDLVYGGWRRKWFYSFGGFRRKWDSIMSDRVGNGSLDDRGVEEETGIDQGALRRKWAKR